jgi:hypothetical protein
VAQLPSLAHLGRPSRPLSPSLPSPPPPARPSIPFSPPLGPPRQLLPRGPARAVRPSSAPRPSPRAPAQPREAAQPAPRPSPGRTSRRALRARSAWTPAAAATAWARASKSQRALFFFLNRLREIPVQQPATTPQNQPRTCAPRPVSRFDFAVSPNRPRSSASPEAPSSSPCALAALAAQRLAGSRHRAAVEATSRRSAVARPPR